MTTYLFEFHVDGGTCTLPVRAADSLDAFDIFRSQHPHVIIANVWVALYGKPS